jgi:hypothetical protein
MCVAGYYTLLTGLGMSLAAAVVVRNLLIVVCIGTLAVAAINLLRRFPVWHRLMPVLSRTKSRIGNDI